LNPPHSATDRTGRFGRLAVVAQSRRRTAGWLNASSRAGVEAHLRKLAGDSLNAITDAVRRDKTIEWDPRAAMRKWRRSRPGAESPSNPAGLGSCAPGSLPAPGNNLHLINGLFSTCHRSRVPVTRHQPRRFPSAEKNRIGPISRRTHPAESVPGVQPLLRAGPRIRRRCRAWPRGDRDPRSDRQSRGVSGGSSCPGDVALQPGGRNTPRAKVDMSWFRGPPRIAASRTGHPRRSPLC